MMRETARDTARTWAEISLGNLEHNYRALRACAPDSRFLATVKANGYGHGAIPVARRLVELGHAKSVTACASHGVLSGPAIQRINESALDEIVFLDTIQPRDNIAEICPKIKYLSVAHLFADAIERIYQEISVSKLWQ